MSDSVECVVIGAGVVGLAVARALSLAGREVVILEAADAIGTGISSRNSEVIHAGMYYPQGSLRAQFCVSGNRLLRNYLTSHGVDWKQTGKLIVATDDQEEAKLLELQAKGRINGVTDLQMISGRDAMAKEPALSCQAALWSPSTGILDTHGYMLALLGDAEQAGAALALKSPVLAGDVLAGDGDNGGIVLQVGGDEPTTLKTKMLVNAAGLGAVPLARRIQGLRQDSLPPFRLCKGNYFLLEGRQPFQTLVYPMPVSAGLGVHYTLDLGGQGRFGPDVEWIDQEGYEVDARRGDSFYAAIRRYWPGLPDGALRPGYCGIRPKISNPEDPARDFMVQTEAEHGVPGLINLLGIESPGLTSSLAIGQHVAALLS